MIAEIVITTDFGSKVKNSKAIKLWNSITDAMYEKNDTKYHKAVISFIKWYNSQTPKP